MENLILRKAIINDAANLTVLKQQVWIATYAVEGIRDEFSNYVLSEFTVEKTKDLIENSNKYIIIAEIENHLVGCIEIAFDTKCPIELIADPEITVLYVLERYCGKGIGKMLLENALLYLKEQDYQTMWLTVYGKNEGAVKFYERNNFQEIGTTYFEMDRNRYENKVLVKHIKNHY